MLSFLVTYYNQQQYVKRSLDSIFSQNLAEEFEVLVGDDGSQDKTCDIVKEYQNKYFGKIRLFIQPRDLNVKYSPIERASANRLNLLKNAKGDYVCFLDGDDSYCDFNWIQESIDKLKDDETLAGVAHNYCERFPDGKIENPAGIENHAYITARLYCRRLYTHAGTILFRNKFTDADYILLSALKSFDDNDITYYFLNFGNLLCDNKVVYSYYQNNNSIWHTTNEIEKSIINAVDYEIIKKILSKYHFQLFLKYYSSVFYAFKNRKYLHDEKYKRYRNQCVLDGDMIKILNWNELTTSSKISLFVKIFMLKMFQFIFCKIIR